MKIAILSMQRIVNYGSVLQAWSLRQMIREVSGVTADFLDIEDSPALKSNAPALSEADYQSPAYYSQHVLQKTKRRIITMLSGYNKKLIRRFMQKELKLDAAETREEYELVIVGSDEVFNHAAGIRLQLHGLVKQAREVISYAASCGSAKAEHVCPEDVKMLRDAMKRFASVSVRDEGTARYVSCFYDGLICKHMDPVLMGELYARKARKVWLKGYMLVYAYGQRIRTANEIEAIRTFARQKGLRIVAMGGSQFWCDLYIPASPMRLLDWFAHADYVVTDTFHGAVFSVINQKRFAVIVRPSNENKLTSLLKDLPLEQRKVEDPTMLGCVLDASVDYDAVNTILARERIRARAYLKEHLINEQASH